MNTKKPTRKSIRLKGFDYSNHGWYYLTICAQNRKCIFGDIKNGEMFLNDCGKMVNQWYLKIPKRFKNIKLDQYQIMPNHMHGIIVINNGSTHGSTPTVVVTKTVGADQRVRPSTANPPTLSKLIQWFKTMTTNYYIRGVNNNGWQSFNKRMWQRNFWEHIIRTESDLEKIRTYIKNNPIIWYRDKNNPNNIRTNSVRFRLSRKEVQRDSA